MSNRLGSYLKLASTRNGILFFPIVSYMVKCRAELDLSIGNRLDQLDYYLLIVVQFWFHGDLKVLCSIHIQNPVRFRPQKQSCSPGSWPLCNTAAVWLSPSPPPQPQTLMWTCNPHGRSRCWSWCTAGEPHSEDKKISLKEQLKPKLLCKHPVCWCAVYIFSYHHIM